MPVVRNVLFILASLAFGIRKSLPLFYNDHARLASLYAWILLGLFQSRSISLNRKVRLLNLFSRNFLLPVSIDRLARTLSVDPRREAFLSLLEHKTSPLTQDARSLLIKARHVMRSFPDNVRSAPATRRERFFYPELPDIHLGFYNFDYRGEDGYRFSNILPARQKGRCAVVIIGSDYDAANDLDAFNDFEELIVFPYFAHLAPSQIDDLQTRLGPTKTITVLDPRSFFSPPYSDRDQIVSDFCDRTADKMVQKILEKKPVRDFIPAELDSEISLMVSDTLYYPVQRFLSAMHAVKNYPASVPVFCYEQGTSLTRALARECRNPVFALSYKPGQLPERPVTDNPPDAGLPVSDINYIRKRLDKACPRLRGKKTPHLIIATNTRQPSYKRALKFVRDYFSRSSQITVFDFGAPSGKKENLRAGFFPRISNALDSASSPMQNRLSAFFGFAHSLPDDVDKDSHINPADLDDLIIESVSAKSGEIAGNILLFKKISSDVADRPGRIMLSMPGRYPTIRCLTRAFQKTGIPTLDLQILFVSEMARYRPPVSTYSAVIDSFARDHYIRKWGIDPECIETIGSILHDQDIRQTAGFSGQDVQAEFSGRNDLTCITLATQPLPEIEILEAVSILADYVKSTDQTHLCIKLHPGQSDRLRDKIQEVIKNAGIEASRYSVLRTVPFAKVMAMTDIMICYFSNISLLAPFFRVPVISLPTSAPQPALTLADMGLATPAASLNALTEILDEKLQSGDRATARAYIETNPHMIDPNALGRLNDLINRLIK